MKLSDKDIEKLHKRLSLTNSLIQTIPLATFAEICHGAIESFRLASVQNVKGNYFTDLHTHGLPR